MRKVLSLLRHTHKVCFFIDKLSKYGGTTENKSVRIFLLLQKVEGKYGRFFYTKIERR